MSEYPLYHLRLQNIDSQTCLETIHNLFNEPQNEMSRIFFLNAHCFNISLQDSEYKEALDECFMLLNDGIGIKIASKLKGVEVKENLNGTDLIPKIIESSANNNQRVYLLGGSKEVIDTAASNFRSSFPSLKLAGYHDGFFKNDDAMIQDIIDKKTDVLIVGMGVPYQEKWLHKNSDKLSTIKLAVAGGAIFDFTAGRFNRAPALIQKLGMEWAYRLYNEPKRLFRRYVFGNITFLFHIFMNK